MAPVRVAQRCSRSVAPFPRRTPPRPVTSGCWPNRWVTSPTTSRVWKMDADAASSMSIRHWLRSAGGKNWVPKKGTVTKLSQEQAVRPGDRPPRTLKRRQQDSLDTAAPAIARASVHRPKHRKPPHLATFVQALLPAKEVVAQQRNEGHRDQAARPPTPASPPAAGPG
jgi:hypothetical protein